MVELGVSCCHFSRIVFSKSPEENGVLDSRIKFSANLFRVNLAGIVLGICSLNLGVLGGRG